jgi:hypothetical protein
MTRTTATQPDFFGDDHRIYSWGDIIDEFISIQGSRKDIKEEADYNRLIIALVYFTGSPEVGRAIRGIIKSGDIETGRQLLIGMAMSKNMPSFETLTRGMRSAKEKRKAAGDFRNEERTNDPNLDELLVQIEEAHGNFNSNIEAQFKAYITKRLPLYRWEENVKFEIPHGIYRGRVIIPDLVCQKFGLSIEIDSWEFHQDKISFTSDRMKSRIMQSLGYYHLQFSGTELSVRSGMHYALEQIKWFIENKCSAKPE